MLNEGIRVEEVKTCLLCNTEGLLLYKEMCDRLFSAPGIWNFFRCPKCGLIWLNPRPLSDEINKIYASYFTHTEGDRNQRWVLLKNQIKWAIIATDFGYNSLLKKSSSRLIGRVLSLLPGVKEMAELSIMCLDGHRKGKLLDVGCGDGQFLAQMQHLGWEAMGIEPDREAAKVAQEHFNIPVMAGTLESAKFPDNFFDAVTLSHTIEHVSNPIWLLQECRRVLKQNGKLVVTTPNVASLGHQRFGKAWWGMDPPRHFYLFSLQTLADCAEESGFHIQRLYTTARWAREIWDASRLIRRECKIHGWPYACHISWSLRLEGLIFQIFEHGLRFFRNNVGEELVLIAYTK